MTNEQLDSLEAKAKAATPGPWERDKRHRELVNHGIWVICECDTVSDIDVPFVGKANAAYIAAANPAVVLELIAELRQLKQRCTQLSKERTYLAKCLEYKDGPDMRVSAYEYIARAKEATCQK